jgi:CRISPR-associated endonuclease/helicase Cas3
MNMSTGPFWAKTGKDKIHYHNLLWHLIDAGIVTQHLWDQALAESFKSDISQTLSLSVDQARDLLAFWVALHDIGKAGPAFQRKWEDGKNKAQNSGFNFPNSPIEFPGFHGHASTWILETYFLDTYQKDVHFCKQLAKIIGGHHGTLATANEMRTISLYKKDHLGDSAWETARVEIINELHHVFSPQDTFSIPQEKEPLNAFLILIAGLTTTADWIASNDLYFHFDDGNMEINSYIEQSNKEAKIAIQQLGWGNWKAQDRPNSFQELFPAFQPNTLQSAFIEQTKDLQPPFLVILEAPTGSGKTESAFYLADTTLQQHHHAGIYIAMPSQATSNQMFERTTRFLSKRYSENILNVQLLHGASMINEFFQNVRLHGIAQDDYQAGGNITAEEWFLPSKKSLLAPFGVGTVDQAFLSVLCSKHFFLRLFGLSNKIIIFDEVHAYDVYMLEIFKRLLYWLKAVNASVIMLSATLPHQSRMDLLQTYTDIVQPVSDVPFPRLSISTAQHMHVASLGEVSSRTITLQWIEETGLLASIQEQLSQGGNAAILCNRVDQAIEIYQQLSQIYPKEELTLFHSRFPYSRREEIEEKVKQLYGKNINYRPHRSIIVATQVIEQSLDLDFDIMFSALAPIDMLIQRAGRLQRHRNAKTPPQRPSNLQKPQLIILRPNLESVLPNFGKDRYIYEPYLLQRTWYTLCHRSDLSLPADTDELIEKVYSDQYIEEIPADLWTDIQDFYKNMVDKSEKDQYKAKKQLIPIPQYRNMLNNTTITLKEENNPQAQSVMHVLTRNARPSVRVVCLIQEGDQLFTLDEHKPVDLDKKPDHKTIRACLRSAVSFSQRQIVEYFFSQPVSPGWKQCAALRSYFVAIFQENRFRAGERFLTLSSEMGIIISSEQSEKED